MDGFQTGMGPITDRVINAVADKLSSEDVQKTLTTRVIEPITVVVQEKIRPYLYVGFIFYLVLLILVMVILFMVIRSYKAVQKLPSNRP